MTLNLKKEINTLVKNTEECNHLLLPEGGFHEYSAINQFNNRFYLTEQKYIEPNFVTEYAKTNIAEDIAETFAFMWVKTPSTKLQKKVQEHGEK